MVSLLLLWNNEDYFHEIHHREMTEMSPLPLLFVADAYVLITHQVKLEWSFVAENLKVSLFPLEHISFLLVHAIWWS